MVVIIRFRGFHYGSEASEAAALQWMDTDNYGDQRFSGPLMRRPHLYRGFCIRV